MATVVTIGRDVDGVPMAPVRWADFRYEVRRCFDRRDIPVYFVGDGVGTSEQWGQEDAWTIVAGEVPGAFIDELLEELEAWRRFFHQEAVAVTLGRTYFV